MDRLVLLQTNGCITIREVTVRKQMNEVTSEVDKLTASPLSRARETKEEKYTPVDGITQPGIEPGSPARKLANYTAK